MVKRSMLCAAALTLILTQGCSDRGDIERTGLVRLSGGVYAYIAGGPSSEEGLGANAGFVVGGESVLVVDSRYTERHARKLLEAIRSVTDLPVRYLVNTHYHPDHVWGNSVFRDEGAVILARPETKIEMERYTPVYMEYYRERRPEVFEMIGGVEPAYPDSLVGDELTIGLGGKDAVLLWYGPGHTAGDLLVWVPSAKVVFTGGLVSNGYHPNLGDQGTDCDNWLAILSRIEELNPDIIVPGQGFAGGPELIDRQRSYIVNLTALCVDAIRNGLSLSEAIAGISVPGTEGYLQENLLPFNIQALYRRRVLDVVDPRFEMDIPAGFTVSDGGGSSRAGMVQWIFQSEEGYLELEVSWSPSRRNEVIVQDVRDVIARYAAGTDRLYELGIEGSKKIEIGGREAPAVFGRWSYRSDVKAVGSGAWVWTLRLMDGKLYSIRMLTNAGGDRDLERRNIASLEAVAASLRTADAGS
jgi:cyclase